MIGLMARKMGMTQIFESDSAIPVTLLKVEPGTVVDIKTQEKNSYCALQLGFSDVKENKLNKSLVGYFKKKNVPYKRMLREFKYQNIEEFKIGDVIGVDIFKVGETARIQGYSKGKGFSGTMKRHGFHGGPASHGGMMDRKPGSIGMCEYPGRVIKGKKMAGHYGNKKVTIKTSRVVFVDNENSIIGLKGNVLGGSGSWVKILKGKQQ
ncbi:MAG: 50S ribosomal protein L3 [Deltaproteobacteria bacterium]|nr:50S ribosomal protein L3 [Deltaproteobacteria bacterium]